MNIVQVMSYIVRIGVLNCLYYVMYNAYVCIHMPPVMCYTVGVMSLTESV